MPTTYGILIKNGINYSHDTASSVSYSNSTSGISSTNVQDAIDYLVSNKVDKETGKGLFSGSYDDLTNKPTIPAAVAVKGNNEQSYRTGNVNLTASNIGSLWSASGVTINNLNDLANLLNNSSGERAFAVTAKITTDIGVGVTGWQRILGLSQNGPNNGSYDLGLYCIFLPSATSEVMRYAIINGKTTKNF